MQKCLIWSTVCTVNAVVGACCCAGVTEWITKSTDGGVAELARRTVGGYAVPGDSIEDETNITDLAVMQTGTSQTVGHT